MVLLLRDMPEVLGISSQIFVSVSLPYSKVIKLFQFPNLDPAMGLKFGL